MSRSVKSFFPWDPTRANTSRLFLQVAIAILILQLANSQRLPNESPYYSEARNRIPKLLTRDEPEDNDVSDDYEKGSTFRFKNPHFEISYEVFNTDNEVNEPQNRMQNHQKPKTITPSPKSEKDLVDDMIKKIFWSPREWAARRDGNAAKRFASRSRSQGETEDPPDCEGKLICDVDDSYPTNDIDAAVMNEMNLQPLFHVDTIPADPQSRSDGVNGLCESTERRIYLPKRARKKVDDGWIQVANTDNFKQGIAISECKDVAKPCIQYFNALISGYTAVCKQHYDYRSLVVINATDTKPYVSTFRIPSGCCCYKLFQGHNEK